VRRYDALKGGPNMPRFRDRVRRGAYALLLGAAFALGGCSTVKPSTTYLKGLQQIAMQGGFAVGASVDVAGECPSCGPEETVFAQNIIGAEQKFGVGCKGVPEAEASYRSVRAMMNPQNSIPEYAAWVANRMCVVADQYQACTTSPRRVVPAGAGEDPAGALTAAIDECRVSNPAEADDILNRAIAQEGESVNRAILAGDYMIAKPELRVYAALPRSSKLRAEEWRNTIANEESADSTARSRILARIKSMVCDESYYAQNPDTGYANMLGALNMSHGGRIGPDNPFEPVSKTDTKESRMAVLSWELSNSEELSTGDAQQMLQRAYDRAAKDSSYCSASASNQ
jgi:hypothetical protein